MYGVEKTAFPFMDSMQILIFIGHIFGGGADFSWEVPAVPDWGYPLLAMIGQNLEWRIIEGGSGTWTRVEFPPICTTTTEFNY